MTLAVIVKGACLMQNKHSISFSSGSLTNAEAEAILNACGNVASSFMGNLFLLQGIRNP